MPTSESEDGKIEVDVTRAFYVASRMIDTLQANGIPASEAMSMFLAGAALMSAGEEEEKTIDNFRAFLATARDVVVKHGEGG